MKNKEKSSMRAIAEAMRVIDLARVMDLAHESFVSYKRKLAETGHSSVCGAWFKFTAVELGFNDTTFLKHFIKDIYEEFSSSNDYKIHAELSVVLNWKIWEWWRIEKRARELEMTEQAGCFHELGILYNDLWHKSQDIFYNKFKGNEEAQRYYFEYTD